MWRFIFVLFFPTILSAAEPISPDDLKVLDIKYGGFTINENPAASIYIGIDGNNFCSFTYSPSNLKKNILSSGNSIHFINSTYKNINYNVNSDCHWYGRTFVLSTLNKHRNSVFIGIEDIDYSTSTAKIYISLKLIDLQTATLPVNDFQFFTADRLMFTVSDPEHYQNLFGGW